MSAALRTFKTLARVAVFVAALIWLWYSIGDSFTLNDLAFTGDLSWLVLLLALLPLNLFLEVLKWHLLTRSFGSRSPVAALRGVLLGNFYALITPNRIGDGIGRVLDLPPGSKTRGTYAFINSSIAQSLVTLSAGALALVFAPLWLVANADGWFESVAWLQWPIYIGTLVTLLLYLEPGWVRMLRSALPKTGWVGTRVQTLQTYPRRMHAAILVLSTFRYVVFAIQFYAALCLYGFDGAAEEILARIAVVYLFTMLIPTAALAEFGIRESMAVLILPVAGIRPEAAFSATLVLYLINICLPAFTGGVVFAQNKKRSSR